LQHVGLALATSLSAMLNTSLLFWGLYKAGIYRPQAGWLAFAMRLLSACALMCLVLWLLVGDAGQWFVWGEWRRIGELSLLVAAGLLAYLLGLGLAGLRPRHLRH
jgi:putative peptidoglycan lipid II flippase